jgi:AraC-like DNA-binding protein
MRIVPLVRAGALRPLLQAAAKAGVPVERRLDEAGIANYPWDDSERPIPLLSGLDVLRRVANGDGLRDLGCRVDPVETLAALGHFGQLLVNARTPREALRRAADVFSAFCTHQRLVVRETATGPVVALVFPRGFDPAGVHVAHQYSATIVKALIQAATPGKQPFRRVVISAGAGTTGSLQAALADEVEVIVGAGNGLWLHVDPDVFDRPFPSVPRPSVPLLKMCLADQAGLVVACRAMIDQALDTRTPTIGQLALAAGLSVRTLQRELALEGTSFRALLDDVRRSRALGALQHSLCPLPDIAGDLGYAEQACLSRAVRRWTGTTPTRLRPAERRRQRG